MKTHKHYFKIILTVLGLAFILTAYNPVHAQTARILFAVIGDYGIVGQPAADVASLVKSWNPDFIVTTGDNNQNDRPYEMDDNIGQYYHEYLVNYKGKYGEGSPTRRFFPSPGNHDWAGDGLKSYLEYFDLRTHQRYYDFVQGPVHFFMLDSDRNEPDGVDAKSEQAIWLKKALAASTSSFNVVVFHQPPYTSGWHRSSEYMRWPFKEWGADIVLSGHNHLYERLYAGGLPYIINGLGGAEIYKFETVIPESLVRFNQDHGAMRVEATNAYMKFQMFTRTGLLVDEYIIGQGYPTVSSVSLAGSSPTNTSELVFQVVFSEAVTGVDAADFAVSSNINGVAINTVSGSGTAYLVSVNSGNGDGTVRLDVIDDDSILNATGSNLGGLGTGNGNFSSGASYQVDKSAPTVLSILRTGSSPTNAEFVEYVVTFSEPVIGVDNFDFNLTSQTGATINNVSGTGNSYTISITTGVGTDQLRLDFVDNDSVLDLAGNQTSQGFTGEEYSIDRLAPVVTSISRAGQASDASVDYTVSFSEPVTGVDGGDFLLSTMNGAVVESISGSGNLYTVRVILNPGSDVIRLDLRDNDSIVDSAGNNLGGAGAGNGNFFGETIPIAIDTPIVTSIIRSGSEFTNASTMDFIVTFSETVNGVDISDFKLTGATDANIVSVTSVNPFYIVSVNSGSTNGQLKLDLSDNDTITNSQGIPLGGTGVGNGDFINGESYTIDKTPPQVTSIIRAGNNPTINPTVDFIVTFSEPVSGVDSTDFSVTTSNLSSAIVNIQNANPFYVVTVSTGLGSGTLRLDLKDDRSISDQAGNLLAGDGGFTLGEVFSLARIPVNFPATTVIEISRGNLTNSPLPKLSWTSVRGALAYELFIARDTNFTQVIQTYTLKETSLIPSQPLVDGTYYMRVWAFNADANPGKFSKIYSFTVDTSPPASPLLTTPVNNATAQRKPWLGWKAVSGAAQYEVQVDNNADFSSPEFSTATNKASIQSKTLISKRIYYWRVRAKDAAGNWSAWSAVSGFTVR